MMKNLLAEQHAALAQQGDDLDVGVEDVFADQIWQTGFVGETAVIIDRRKDRKAFFLPTQKIFFTMGRRDLDQPSSGVRRYKVGCENLSSPVQKRMMINKLTKNFAFDASAIPFS